jgi:hypothetical protein
MRSVSPDDLRAECRHLLSRWDRCFNSINVVASESEDRFR